LNVANPQFVVDANVFIEAAKRYYAFDIAPSFWEAMAAHVNSGVLCSIDRILDELKKGKDQLADWADKQIGNAFHKSDGDGCVQAYGGLMQWVAAQSFTPPAVAEFAKVADGWLVAYAQSISATVVTDEIFDANIKRKVKIPNVCRAFTIPCINTFEMMRALGIKLGR
jgi:hypothetical protein